MKVEHVAMYVKDLEKAREFFVKYFGAVSNAGYHNERTGFRSYFLELDEGARIEIMNKPGLDKLNKAGNDTMDEKTNKIQGEEKDKLGYAHIAFSVGSREKVDELTQQMREDGYHVVSGPRTTGDGYYESCILDLEGNRIEITV
ncbi:MAG: VOC family protein [Lachnospiraceae bacterium]